MFMTGQGAFVKNLSLKEPVVRLSDIQRKIEHYKVQYIFGDEKRIYIIP